MCMACSVIVLLLMDKGSYLKGGIGAGTAYAFSHMYMGLAVEK